jgi:hypothetical protein
MDRGQHSHAAHDGGFMAASMEIAIGPLFNTILSNPVFNY